MKTFIFIFFFLFPVLTMAQINQTDAKGLRQGRWQKMQPNGKPMYDGYFKDGLPVGEWKRFHEGGQIKAKIAYRTESDSADAQLFDQWGKKVATGVYLNEKKAGNWVYLTDMRRVAEEFFVDGEKNGKARKYYNSGELWEETDWVNGKQEGSHRVFFKNGQPFLQVKMSNDKQNGLCLSYFTNGRVEMEAGYKNGLRHGEWKYFDEDGKFLYSLFYEDGKILNPQVRDSISNLQLQNMEKDRGKVLDPEKYMNDPSEYMQQIEQNK